MGTEVQAIDAAIKSNNLEQVTSLLSADPQLVGNPTPRGTLLHTAAGEGHIAILQHLLRCHADVNAVDEQGISPLMVAAQGGYTDGIFALLDANADASFFASSGASALHYAAKSGNVDVVECLINHHAAINNNVCEAGSPLHWAASAGELGPVALLLELQPALLQTTDAGGWTPLHRSVSEGHMDLTLFLLERGAAPDVVTSDGRTALHLAVSGGYVESVRHLLAFGAALPPAWQSLAETAGPAAKDIARELQRKADGAYDMPEEKRLESMEKFKAQGNKVFQAGEFSKSAKFYTLAISFSPKNHVLYSNRSAAYYNLRRLHAALADASYCVSLKPDWAKGYFRKGASLVLLERLDEAKAVFEAGLQLDPKSADLRGALGELEKTRAKRGQ